MTKRTPHPEITVFPPTRLLLSTDLTTTRSCLGQQCRDVGHMYASGIDFSQTSPQNVLQSLAPGIDLTSTNSTAVIILSTITKISQTDCTAAKINVCANKDQAVITRRIVIPSSSSQTSAFGSPGASTYQDLTSGLIKPSAYMGDTSTQAKDFLLLLPSLDYDHYAYVAEMYVQSPFLGKPTVAGLSIF